MTFPFRTKQNGSTIVNNYQEALSYPYSSLNNGFGGERSGISHKFRDTGSDQPDTEGTGVALSCGRLPMHSNPPCPHLDRSKEHSIKVWQQENFTGEWPGY
jgi:hypothetical protein